MRRNLVRLTVVMLLVLGLAVAEAAEKQPVCVAFFYHFEVCPIRGVGGVAQYPPYSGEGPVPNSITFQRTLEICERYGIKVELGATPMSLLQLKADFPDVLETIRTMKMPVTYYPDEVGQFFPAPSGRRREIPGIMSMNIRDRAKAEWRAETRTLVPSWMPRGHGIFMGNPEVGRPIESLDDLAKYRLPAEPWQLYGGILATEALLGVTPMDVFQPIFRNLAGVEQPQTRHPDPVRRALGMNWFEPSYWPGEATIAVPSLSGQEGLQWLAKNWPRDKIIQVRTAFDLRTLPQLIEFLQGHADDFKIVWPDPEARQWEAKNSPVEFFRKTYGVNSLEDVTKMEPPVDKIMELALPEYRNATPLVSADHPTEGKDWEDRLLTQDQLQKSAANYARSMVRMEAFRPIPDHLKPKTMSLSRAEVEALAKQIVEEMPGAEIPARLQRAVRAGDKTLSLAQAYCALLGYLDQFIVTERYPDKIEIAEVLGPVGPKSVEEESGPREQAGRGQGEASNTLNEANLLYAVYLTAKQVRSDGAIPAATQVPQTNPGYLNAGEMLRAIAGMVAVLADEGLPKTIPLVRVAEYSPDPASPGAANPCVAINSFWTEPEGAGALEAQTGKVKREAFVAAADYMVRNWPVAPSNHGGHFAGPPDFVLAGSEKWSLAKTFQVFCEALKAYRDARSLPESVETAAVMGPIDYPMFETEEEPKYDVMKYNGGFVPAEMDPKFFPPTDLLARMGLPTTRDVMMNRPVAPKVVFDALDDIAASMKQTGHVPGVIPVTLPPPRPGQEAGTAAFANPAEFLIGMAQVVRALGQGSEPEQIVLTNMRVIEDQKCGTVGTLSPLTLLRLSYLFRQATFIWREKVPVWRLNRAWTYTPL